MSKEFIIPSEPHRISELPFHALMQMTRDGKPIIGMKVGTAAASCLLVVAKDGTVTSISDVRGNRDKIAFVDYLSEDDSVEIFGSMKEGEEAQHVNPIIAQVAFSKSQAENGNLSYFPSWVPFINRNNQVCMLIPNYYSLSSIHGRSKRIIATYYLVNGLVHNDDCGAGFDIEEYGLDSGYFERTYKLKSGPHLEYLSKFKNHKNVRSCVEKFRDDPTKEIPDGW